VFGTFDRGALKRGFQIYSEVCSACHSLRLLSYRNLKEIGFSKNEIKAIAAEKEVQDGPNDDGEMFMRPAKPADRFVSPYPNKKAAQAANNGALPPDLSLIVKARKGGADYIHALLTGYKDEPPKGFNLLEGSNYNIYFPGNQIAMPAPLSDDAVEYADGTKPTLDQLARDISTFLAWTSSPELEARKSMGIKVILFLLVLTGMLYALMKRIWAKLH
ncbi:MAG TPA: cytochrome c1, partial [Rhodospirillales bacterium]|nr:cytochrome c1 [Rhodospirillales bacterium]